MTCGGHRGLDRGHFLALAAGQHRTDRPPPDQPGRNEVQPLGTLLPDDAALGAALRTEDLRGLDPFFHDFQMLGQRVPNRFAGLALDVRRNDDVRGGGGLGVLEDLLEQRELVLLDREPFGLGAEEFGLEPVDLELQQPLGPEQFRPLLQGGPSPSAGSTATSRAGPRKES